MDSLLFGRWQCQMQIKQQKELPHNFAMEYTYIHTHTHTAHVYNGLRTWLYEHYLQESF